MPLQPRDSLTHLTRDPQTSLYQAIAFTGGSILSVILGAVGAGTDVLCWKYFVIVVDVDIAVAH